ncbi:MAG: zf-HC2 domain-containing protein [Candidatus Limnocylindrales bacterium]
MSGDVHARFRELLAERIDTPLAPPDETALETHLSGCAACRVVERDYAAQRQQLHSLATIEAPRDLWARTRTAIDHEIARTSPPARPAASLRLARAGTARQMRLAVGALVGVMVVLLVAGGTLLQGNPFNPPGPTPFSIPPQSIAYLDYVDGKTTIYQADVAQVCPPTNVDCRTGPESRPVARFVAGEAQQLALGGNGQAFIASRDAAGGEVFSIVDLAPPVGPRPSPTATPGDTGSAGPSGTPGTTAGATTGDTSTPPATAGETPGGASPTDTLLTAARPILTGVSGTGAPAAWSPDGTILAFSAMPIDHSQGSDVYVWRAGDEVAQPLTTDHRSYFASWSGERIVISRLSVEAPGAGATPTPAGDGTTASTSSAAPSAPTEPAAAAETVVIDPASAEERPVDLPAGWLPSVDPTRRWVVYWTGRLSQTDGVIVPEAGELLVADWASIDPWAADDAAASPEPSAPDTTPGTGTPKPKATGRPEPTDTQVPTARPTDTPTASASESVTDAGGGATPTDGLTASPALPDRPDAVSGDTGDWVVRWSADGAAFGVWTSSGPQGTGWLTIRSAPSFAPPAGDLLLGPTAARRSFAVGTDRVVWVSPAANGDGELWMATWGAGGPGSLRIRSLDSAEAVPAF